MSDRLDPLDAVFADAREMLMGLTDRELADLVVRISRLADSWQEDDPMGRVFSILARLVAGVGFSRQQDLDKWDEESGFSETL